MSNRYLELDSAEFAKQILDLYSDILITGFG